MKDVFKVKIERPNLNRYSMSFYNCDVECGVCGRPIRDRSTCSVVVRHRPGEDEEGRSLFLPIPQEELPNDPVEWGTFVGSHCSKLLPKTHKITYKKLLKKHSHTWC